MSARSELKENILANQLEGVVGWVIENRQKVLIGLGLAVVVGLISSVFVLRQKEITETNWTRLAQAQALADQHQYEQATQVFKEIRAASPSGPLYLFSSFYLGEAEIATKNYDQAIGYFNDVISHAGAAPIKALAMSNLAQTYELKKDFNSAAQTYQQFLEHYSDHFLAARTQLALGRALLMAGRDAEAKKALEQLVDLYPTSDWATIARSIMDKKQAR